VEESHRDLTYNSGVCPNEQRNLPQNLSHATRLTVLRATFWVVMPCSLVSRNKTLYSAGSNYRDDVT
jgi:hypothetical protein